MDQQFLGLPLSSFDRRVDLFGLSPAPSRISQDIRDHLLRIPRAVDGARVARALNV